MRTQIDIITGFLEAGKTTLIRKLLQNGLLEAEQRIVLLLCEQGMEELDALETKWPNLRVRGIAAHEELNSAFFLELKKNDAPQRIIIEYNGTWQLSDLLRIKLPSGYDIGRIVQVVDGSTFTHYLSNMGSILGEQISNGDLILINRWEQLANVETDGVKQLLKNINPGAKQVFLKEDEPGKTFESLLPLTDKGPVHKLSTAILTGMALWVAYLYWRILHLPGFSSQLALLQTVNTLFLSIVIQAVPFVLIGVFISSILQVFVADDRLVRVFATRKWFGFPLAIGLGVFFPVCDCAMAPITARMIKKGVPLGQAITFMLAAPAVNPVVLAAIWQAFPGQPRIVAARIVLGVLIALLVGITLSALPVTTRRSVVAHTLIGPACASGYLGNIVNIGLAGKIEAVFRHAGMEFLNIGRFVIAGAFISSLLQVVLPRTGFAALGSHPLTAWVVMLIAAFLMSVCSSSNPFIGRSFANIFSLGPVLGFMVMGPMLDLKNLFMLTGSFRKRFVGGLVVVLLGVFSVVFWIFATLFI